MNHVKTLEKCPHNFLEPELMYPHYIYFLMNIQNNLNMLYHSGKRKLAKIPMLKDKTSEFWTFYLNSCLNKCKSLTVSDLSISVYSHASCSVRLLYLDIRTLR